MQLDAIINPYRLVTMKTSGETSDDDPTKTACALSAVTAKSLPTFRERSAELLLRRRDNAGGVLTRQLLVVGL